MPPVNKSKAAPEDPRGAALIALDAVLRGGRSLNRVAPEQPLAKAICYGVLRWRPLLQALLAGYLRKPLREREHQLESLLLVGIYQLGWMDKPAHAVINQTVSAARQLDRRKSRQWVGGLVNAVLRSYQRDGCPKRVDSERINHAHPDWLQDRINQAWPQQAQQIFEANNAQAPLWLRVNQQQYSRDQYIERLQQADIVAEPSVQLNIGAEHALRLQTAVDVAALPGFADGAVSVQDLAAQLAAPLLQPMPGQRVLDACAAPGGKTAHLLELCGQIDLLAIDSDSARAKRISETLTRLKLRAQCQVADAAAPDSWVDGRRFDRILLDVPCSASGVIRRHPDIKWLRRDSDIADLVRRQAQLLSANWPLLQAGGQLLYTTCSVLPDENAEQITNFLANHRDARLLSLPAELGIDTGAGVQRLPEVNGSDGFFYALLGKSARDH